MKSIYSLTSLCIALSLATPLTQAADSTPAAATDKPAETASAPKAEKPIELPDPVAVVDGTEIKKSELTEAFDAVVAQAGKKSEEISNSQRLDGYTAILNDMVIDKIMAKVSAKQEVSAAEVDAAFDKSVKLQFETVDKSIKSKRISGLLFRNRNGSRLKSQEKIRSPMSRLRSFTINILNISRCQIRFEPAIF